MIHIRKALPRDLDGINSLLSNTIMPPISVEYLNGYDIATVATDGPRIIGFIWCGVMAKRCLGYIDKFVVDKEYRKKKIGEQITRKTLQVVNKKGVHKVVGVISRSEFHEQSAMNALKCVMKANDYPCTFIYTNISEAVKEVDKLLLGG